ncbi:MAG: hypothetical protein QM610_11750 [Chitinophagaceae bacterium]
MTKQKIKLVENLSYIDNIDDLHAKIRQTKAALRIDKKALLEGSKHIPAEGVKALFGNAMPFFAKTTTAEKTWNLVQSLVALFVLNPKKDDFEGAFDKRYIQHTAKQLGIYLGLNLVRSFIAKRQKKG